MHHILMEKSPVSFHIVILIPYILAFAAWSYLNWIFLHDPFAFIKERDSAFIGAWEFAPYIPWLVKNGGHLVSPLFKTILMSATMFPLSLYVIYRGIVRRFLTNAFIAIYLIPPLAAAFATFNYFLDHPMRYICLINAAVIAGAVVVARAGFLLRNIGLALMLAGSMAGWLIFDLIDPTQGMSEWRQAIEGVKLEDRHVPEVTLGRWLRNHKGATLMDDKGAYMVISERGDAKGLILPFMMEFKLNFYYKIPAASLVVVPDPKSKNGRENFINQRYPDLYQNGIPGYQLAYDSMGWRVYQNTQTS